MWIFFLDLVSGGRFLSVGLLSGSSGWWWWGSSPILVLNFYLFIYLFLGLWVWICVFGGC